MKISRIYYISRFVLVALISAIFAWSGLPWWMAALVFSLGVGFFAWAPSSGRYRVVSNPQGAPLRVDERVQQIRDRAGRNAFVITEVLFFGLYLYGQTQEPATISAAAIGVSLAIGMLAYMALLLLYERMPYGE
jgi:hypothetical protein